MGGVSADGRTLWLSGRYDGHVYGWDTRTGKLVARIHVGGNPHGLLVWPQPGRYSLGPHREPPVRRGRPPGSAALRPRHRVHGGRDGGPALRATARHPSTPSSSAATAPPGVGGPAARRTSRVATDAAGGCRSRWAVRRSSRRAPAPRSWWPAVSSPGTRRAPRRTPSAWPTATSRPLPRLPVDVHDTAGVRLGGRTLVLGGGNASEQAVVQARRRGRWRVDGRLPAARSDLTAVVAHGRAYVVGGYDGRQSRPGRRAGVARRPLVAGGGTPAAAGAVRRHRARRRCPLGVRRGAQRRDGRRRAAHRRRDRAGGGRRAPAPARSATPPPSSSTVGSCSPAAAPVRTASRTGCGGSPRRRGRFTRAGRLPTGLADATPVAADARTAYLVGGETPALTDRVVRLTLR